MHLSKFSALLDLGLRAGDLLCVIAAAHLAYWARFQGSGMESAYQGAQVMVLLVSMVVFAALRLYQQPPGERPLSQFCCAALAWSLSFALVIALGYALKLTSLYSRGWTISFFLIGLALFALSRAAAFAILRTRYRRGRGLSRCVLVGATPAGLRMLENTRRDPSLGMCIVGYVRTPYDQAAPADFPALGGLGELEAVLEESHCDQVLIALPVKATTAISQILDRTEERVVTVKFVPDTLGRQLINHRIDDCAGMPVMTLRASPLVGHAWIWKAFEDRLIASVILALISPVMLALAIGVKLSSPGPILYRQRRVGLDGKEFEMLKFRSMPVNVEQATVQWGNAGAKTNTRFGRFIRQTSLDELPQFLNVLRGDMSIVGPRPERPMFVEKFRQEIPGYMHKHLVKAGITGWAQVNGWRGDTDLVKRIEHDLYYINHWSLWFDLRIIFLTVFKGFVHSEQAQPAPAAGRADVQAGGGDAGVRSGATREELV